MKGDEWKVGIAIKKPSFNVDQVTSASNAAKRFGEIRKKAKELPQFISENNKVDTVILDYSEYEKMFLELNTLKELAWEYELLKRLEQADANPGQSIKLKDAMTASEYKEYLSMNADDIPDEELFED
jgi:PHD/YefM family antitoxin component YafN of YafNO toxin-antitoxin module